MRDLTFTEKNEIDAKLCKCKNCKSIPTIIQRGDLFCGNDSTEYQVVCGKCDNNTKFHDSLNKAIEIWNKCHSNGESTSHIPRTKKFDIVLKMTNRQYEKMQKICMTPVEEALKEGLYKKGKKYVFNAEMEWGQPFVRVIVDTNNLSMYNDGLPRVVLKLFPKLNVGLRNPDADGAILSNGLMDSFDPLTCQTSTSEVFNDGKVYTLTKRYKRRCEKKEYFDEYVIDEITYNFSVKKY